MSKRWAELLLADAADDVASVSLRLPGIVGPGAHGNWLARCRRTLRDGGVLRAANPGFGFNNTIHVDDLARFVARLCRHPVMGAGAVPIAAGKPMRIDAILEAMKHAIGSASPLEFIESGGLPFSISSARATADFGYRAASVASVIERFASDP